MSHEIQDPIQIAQALRRGDVWAHELVRAANEYGPESQPHQTVWDNWNPETTTNVFTVLQAQRMAGPDAEVARPGEAQ
jgi:hypothetical protein